jgi:hypothetical protein
MKSSAWASVEAWYGHGVPELARARREEVERINRDLNERRSPAVRPGSQPAERFQSTPRTRSARPRGARATARPRRPEDVTAAGGPSRGGRPPRSSLEGRSATGWISCCVRDGREPFRARASADIEEAPRLSAENRREAYVPESWCPSVGSPRRYILRKGAKGGVRGTARGKPRFPAWVRRSSAPPRRSGASRQAGARRRVHPP